MGRKNDADKADDVNSLAAGDHRLVTIRLWADGQNSELQPALTDGEGKLIKVLGQKRCWDTLVLPFPAGQRVAVVDSDEVSIYATADGSVLLQLPIDPLFTDEMEEMHVVQLQWLDKDTLVVRVDDEEVGKRHFRSLSLSEQRWESRNDPGEAAEVVGEVSGVGNEDEDDDEGEDDEQADLREVAVAPPRVRVPRSEELGAWVEERLGPSFAREKAKTRRERALVFFRHQPTQILMVLVPDSYSPILISRSAVTIAQWSEGREPGDAPMTNLGEAAIQAWLDRVGDGLRLPTVEEWEKAARGTCATDFWWGKRWKADRCWSAENADAPRPASEHAANPRGLVDVHGNVDEVTVRWSGFVLRGGSFRTAGARCGLSRMESWDGRGRDDVGVRLVRPLT